MTMIHKQEEMAEKMRDILGDKLLVLQAIAYQLDEDFDTNVARIKLKLVDVNDKNRVVVVEGQGAGLVDACFNGLLGAFADEHPSIKSISFRNFTVKGLMSTGDTRRANADAEVELTVLSSENIEFRFTARSTSVGRASVGATLQAVSYFVNSERAFIHVYKVLQHYRSEGRPELVTKYQLLLAQMVQNTSYTEVIDKIKASELPR